MKGTLTKICRAGLLSSFILVSYIAMTSSMTLDLTELRNKVSKIKVNPRGNLWATGHFMGKKSVVDSSFLESAFEDVNVPTEVRVVSPLYRVEDLQALLTEMLKSAQLTQRKQGLDMKVNKDHIVILDSLNYIKGYRYELFCLIKHAQTPHCLVYCLTSDDESSTWNTNRDAAEQYTKDIFDALVLRFEAPDSRNRWDSPLFTILKDDTPPYEAISDALFKRKAPPANQSTQSQPLSSANFLYELDKITQEVLMAVFNAQKTSVPGDLISVPGATEKISLLHIYM
ncbi:Protein KTI12-like protein [Nibea albiflora]|uniref:Protein KTI12-like protein n=1 Tax=Nibea albiflora TaxID=240163 RepID=A0ACB7FF53_NIBAL|nr:Protein KTI12-like protein [Nibea albiflora]